MSNRKTKVPSIPQPDTKDPKLNRAVSAIKEALDVRLGRRGDPLDAAVTFRDLKDGGFKVRLARTGGNQSSISGELEDTVADLITRVSDSIKNGWLYQRLQERIDYLNFNFDQYRKKSDGQDIRIADIKTTQTTLIDEQTAFTQRLDVIVAGYDNQLAVIETNQTTQSSQYQALADQVNTVVATAASKNSVFRQNDQPSGVVDGDVWIKPNDGNSHWSWDAGQGQWIPIDNVAIGQNTAAIQTESSARATQYAAIAQQITTVQTTFNGQIASVQQDITVANQNISFLGQDVNGLGASYTLTVDVNGLVSGYGTYNDGNTSEFGVVSNKFWVAPPGLPNNKVLPFIVDGTVVYIDEARIRFAQVDALSLNGSTVVIPSQQSGTSSATASINIPAGQTAKLVAFGFGTKGVGSLDSDVCTLKINGSTVHSEYPIKHTVCPLMGMSYVTAGTHTAQVTVGGSGDRRCGVILMTVKE